MRKLSLALFAVLVFVGSSAAAFPTDSNQPKSLSAQIQEMLGENSFGLEYDELHAQVRFTLNKKGEIVVLSVDTEDSSLEKFVKGKLNYKKVEMQNINEGKMYTVSVRITA